MNNESRPIDKDIIRLPNALSLNGLQQKSTNHRISKSSLNNEEWEIFFVLEEDKTSKNKTSKQSNPSDQLTDKTKNEATDSDGKPKNDVSNEVSKDISNDEKAELDHLDLHDLEWDDFAHDDTSLTYDEEEHLIFERQRRSTSESLIQPQIVGCPPKFLLICKYMSTVNSQTL